MVAKIDIITYLEVVFLGVGIVWYGTAIFFALTVDSELESMEQSQLMSSTQANSISRLMIFTLLIVGIVLLISAAVAAILYKGVKNRDRNKLKIWMITNSILLGLSLFGIFIQMFSTPSILIKGLIPAAYRAWSLFVVRNYMKKLDEEDGDVGLSTFHSVPKETDVKWTH